MTIEFTYTIEDVKIERSTVSADEWALLVSNTNDPAEYADMDAIWIDVVAVCDAYIDCEDICWDCAHVVLGDGTKINSGAIYSAIKWPSSDLEEAAREELGVEWVSFGGADYTAGGQWVQL